MISTILLTLPALSPLGLFGILIVLVLFVVVAGVLWWAINRLSTAFALPEPVKTLLIVIFVVVCVCALLWFLLSALGMLR